MRSVTDPSSALATAALWLAGICAALSVFVLAWINAPAGGLGAFRILGAAIVPIAASTAVLSLAASGLAMAAAVRSGAAPRVTALAALALGCASLGCMVALLPGFFRA